MTTAKLQWRYVLETLCNGRVGSRVDGKGYRLARISNRSRGYCCLLLIFWFFSLLAITALCRYFHISLPQRILRAYTGMLVLRVLQRQPPAQSQRIGSLGWNRPPRYVQDGTPTYAQTRIHTRAPFVAVTINLLQVRLLLYRRGRHNSVVHQ